MGFFRRATKRTGLALIGHSGRKEVIDASPKLKRRYGELVKNNVDKRKASARVLMGERKNNHLTE